MVLRARGGQSCAWRSSAVEPTPWSKGGLSEVYLAVYRADSGRNRVGVGHSESCEDFNLSVIASDKSERNMKYL